MAVRSGREVGAKAWVEAAAAAKLKEDEAKRKEEEEKVRCLS